MPDTDRGFLDQVASPAFCVRLFAHLPDVVFCMKDRDRRYRAANPAFAERLGFSDPEVLLGKTADDFFPEYLARTYREQDRAVLEGGREISDNLELVTNRDGGVGWYLATKTALRNASGEVIGLASISRDLRTPTLAGGEMRGLRRVVEHIRKNMDEPLPPSELAKVAGLSITQLDRRMRKVFQLSTSAFIRKTRIGHAAELLETTARPVAEIALTCGYGDQTSFTRQFRATVGMPPATYRDHRKRHV